MTLPASLLFLAALQTGTPARTVVTPTEAEVPVSASVQLSVTVYDSAGNAVSAPVRWLSVSPDIASVDEHGLVTGVAPGTTRIAAVVGGSPVFATVTVPQLPASRLVLDAPDSRFRPGTSAPVRVTAYTRLDDVVPPTDVSFASTDPRVATVDPTGRVYFHRAGQVVISARAGSVEEQLRLAVAGDAPSTLRLEPGSPEVRTGDVVRFTLTEAGNDQAFFPEWSVTGTGAEISADGSEGVFVAEAPGTYRVMARLGDAAVQTAMVRVTRRHIPARLTTVGRGPTATHHAGDTWAFEGVDGRDYAYLGTFLHDWLKVWDVTDPGAPVLTDSIQLDARRINDVKIHPNNRIGIVTREGASNRRNGIVILDLSDPAHPTILSEYTETVTGGVHNVWMTSDDLVYACHNGTSELHIIDISDPARPREVGRWGIDKTRKTLHDVIVQDGYAFLSYWDDGVVILDVGAGTHGGTPTSPQFVSQYAYPIGNTHVAWRAGRYLFLGDEIFPPNWNADAPIEARGYIHVVDVSDIEHPVEVARYEVPEAGAHNVWVEGDRLYVGYYQGGLRVVDISGELRGDLYRQGRELAALKTTDANTTVPNWPMTWGAQVFKGRIFTSDLNSGLWILRLDEQRIIP